MTKQKQQLQKVTAMIDEDLAASLRAEAESIERQYGVRVSMAKVVEAAIKRGMTSTPQAAHA
ncbi:hypothetical protein [Pseudomonas oryzihabitans]|uniref:hypothetical protein n=1 Tax=Pseudomonas oryzihabitans TaxID=47885 RepID=UPI0021DB62D2|nr:hypothetical protein [Pseudomonas oryzihabitans]